MKLWSVVALSSLAGVVGWQASAPGRTLEPIPYPEGYREWAHIKSSVIGPTHRNFGVTGGFRHTFANDKALEGFRTRAFPEGSVIVFERLELRDQNGLLVEGPKSSVDVMVRDSVRFAATRGWGFQSFLKDSKTETADSATLRQCIACHEQLAKDEMMISSMRL